MAKTRSQPPGSGPKPKPSKSSKPAANRAKDAGVSRKRSQNASSASNPERRRHNTRLGRGEWQGPDMNNLPDPEDILRRARRAAASTRATKKTSKSAALKAAKAKGRKSEKEGKVEEASEPQRQEEQEEQEEAKEDQATEPVVEGEPQGMDELELPLPAVPQHEPVSQDSGPLDDSDQVHDQKVEDNADPAANPVAKENVQEEAAPDEQATVEEPITSNGLASQPQPTHNSDITTNEALNESETGAQIPPNINESVADILGRLAESSLSDSQRSPSHLQPPPIHEAEAPIASQVAGTKRTSEEDITSGSAAKIARTSHDEAGPTQTQTQTHGLTTGETYVPATHDEPQTRLPSVPRTASISAQKISKVLPNDPCGELATRLRDLKGQLKGAPLDGPIPHGELMKLNTVFQALASVSEAINENRESRGQLALFSLFHPMSLVRPEQGMTPVARPRFDALVPLFRPGQQRPHFSLAILRRNGPHTFAMDHLDANPSLRAAFSHEIRSAASRTSIIQSDWAGLDATKDERESLLGPSQNAPWICDRLHGYNWACGLHAVLNGWAYAFGWELNSKALVGKDGFYTTGIDLVNLAVRGLLDPQTILAFFNCYQYIHPGQDIAVLEGRTFKTTLAFETLEALDRHIHILLGNIPPPRRREPVPQTPSAVHVASRPPANSPAVSPTQKTPPTNYIDELLRGLEGPGTLPAVERNEEPQLSPQAEKPHGLSTADGRTLSDFAFGAATTEAPRPSIPTSSAAECTTPKPQHKPSTTIEDPESTNTFDDAYADSARTPSEPEETTAEGNEEKSTLDPATREAILHAAALATLSTNAPERFGWNGRVLKDPPKPLSSFSAQQQQQQQQQPTTTLAPPPNRESSVELLDSADEALFNSHPPSPSPPPQPLPDSADDEEYLYAAPTPPRTSSLALPFPPAPAAPPAPVAHMTPPPRQPSVVVTPPGGGQARPIFTAEGEDRAELEAKLKALKKNSGFLGVPEEVWEEQEEGDFEGLYDEELEGDGGKQAKVEDDEEDLYGDGNGDKAGEVEEAEVADVEQQEPQSDQPTTELESPWNPNSHIDEDAWAEFDRNTGGPWGDDAEFEINEEEYEGKD